MTGLFSGLTASMLLANHSNFGSMRSLLIISSSPNERITTLRFFVAVPELSTGFISIARGDLPVAVL